MEKKAEKIEEKITNELKKETGEEILNLPDPELEKRIETKVKEKGYLTKEWQIYYAVQRIKEKIKESFLSQKEESAWKKYFSGWNLVINSLIAFIPATIVIAILREMGFGGALIMVGVLWGFIYLVGLLREKTSNKRTKKIAEDIKKSEDRKVVKKDKPKKNKPKKIILAVPLLIVASVVIFFFISNNQQKLSDESTNKSTENYEQITGTLYRNNQYKFRIKFPEGWKIEDGDGPHIIKKATKEGSTVLVYIRDFFEGEEGQLLLDEMKWEYKRETGIGISDSDVKQIVAESTANDFSNEEFKEIMKGVSEGILSKYEESKIIDEGIRYIDNKKSFYVKAEIYYKTLDLVIHAISVNYVTLHKGRIYVISGALSKENFPIVKKQINPSIASFVFEDF